MSTETTPPDGGWSDEELAKIACAAFYLLDGINAPELEETSKSWQQRFWDIARAVRAALAREHDAEWDALNREIADLAAIVHGRPAVTPLRPGETVTIPDVEDMAGPLRVMPSGNGSQYLAVGWNVLDAAGVRALRDVCDRWLAGREGDDGGE